MAGITIAQDTPESTCTPEELQSYQAELVELSGSLAESDDPLETVLAIDTLVSKIQASCSGGIFTKADHTNGIIGPIAFDGSLYEATLEAKGSMAVMTPTVVEGDCGMIFGMPIMTGMTGGMQGDVWEFTNCVALFKVEAPMASDWSLTIKKLR
jgi:hypothetical protein